MRIVFMSCTEIGFRSLEKLIEMGEEVVAVYTMPREFERRDGGG
jgi:methionyl-tRNA formyltransferase